MATYTEGYDDAPVGSKTVIAYKGVERLLLSKCIKHLPPDPSTMVATLPYSQNELLRINSEP